MLRNRKIALFACLGLAVTFVSFVAAHEEHASKGSVVTVKGEVIDTACYFSANEHGAKHKKCAAMCVKNGIPAGLLASDGTVYILNEDHGNDDHVKAYGAMKDHAGDIVTIKGKLIEKSGTKMLFVYTVS